MISDPANPLFANSPSGTDILFTAGDGSTVLPSEIEVYNNNGTKELVAWVKTDISASSPTQLFMYYDGPTVANSSATWNSNYTMVQHLQEDPSSTLFDSTSNANNGTSSGGMTSVNQVAGKIGGALNFDGSNDLVNVGDDTSLFPTDITLEAWASADVFSTWNGIVTNKVGSGDGINLQMGTAQNIASLVSGGGGLTYVRTENGSQHRPVVSHRHYPRQRDQHEHPLRRWRSGRYRDSRSGVRRDTARRKDWLFLHDRVTPVRRHDRRGARFRHRPKWRLDPGSVPADRTERDLHLDRGRAIGARTVDLSLARPRSRRDRSTSTPKGNLVDGADIHCNYNSFAARYLAIVSETFPPNSDKDTNHEDSIVRSHFRTRRVHIRFFGPRGAGQHQQLQLRRWLCGYDHGPDSQLDRESRRVWQSSESLILRLSFRQGKVRIPPEEMSPQRS